jgi:hypothetical protein
MGVSSFSLVCAHYLIIHSLCPQYVSNPLYTIAVVGAHGRLAGIYLVTFGLCIKTLLWRDGRLKPRDSLPYKMLIAALLMLIFASFDIALTIRLTLKALTGSPTLEQLQQYFHLEWTYTMRVGCYVGQTFMGDSILVSKSPRFTGLGLHT